jgi:hypothetical protein
VARWKFASNPQMADPAPPRMEDAVATKTEFNGIGGPANYIRIVPICAAPYGAGKRTETGHARDRCHYRRGRRCHCACSGLFTLGAKSKELTLFNYASLPREVDVEASAPQKTSYKWPILNLGMLSSTK